MMDLVTLHTVDGRDVSVNPAQLVSIGTPLESGTLTPGTRCIIVMVDGKFLSLAEHCAQVLSMFGQRPYNGSPR